MQASQGQLGFVALAPGECFNEPQTGFSPHCRSVQLNGQPLVMVDDGTLPELKPRPLRAGRTLVIPPVTMGFYVVKNVNALACRYR
jgi:hypothetical protein